MSTPKIDQQSVNTFYQTNLAHRKNSVVVGLTAVGFGLLSKHLLGARTLPVSSGKEIFWTFTLTTLSSLVGDEISSKMH